jgi:YD repeat-containing protein
LWSINPVTGVFDNVGTGKVNADGTVVETISGGIRNSSWHFFAPRSKDAGLENDSEPCPTCGESRPYNSEVLLHSGGVLETLELVTYQSLGVARGVTLRYDSLRADPEPIVAFSYVVDSRFGNTGFSNTFLVGKLAVQKGALKTEVPGSLGGGGSSTGEHFWTITGPGTLTGAIQADMRTQPSGLYTYSVESGVLLGNPTGELAGTTSTQSGSFVVVNSISSPFGSGWDVVGLQEIIRNADHSVLLLDGDGSEFLFKPAAGAPGQFVSLPGDFSTLQLLADGTFQRVLKDQTIYLFDANDRLVSVRDRLGNETRYQYRGSFLDRIIDPVGLTTVFTYSGDRVSSIVDPFGRSTLFQYDGEGNLVKSIAPDRSEQTFGYDARHHKNFERDPRGNAAVATYDSAGRAVSATRADGSQVFVRPVMTQALQQKAATFSTTSAPPVGVNDHDAFYTNGNGAVEVVTLDRLGQKVTSADGEGPGETIQRDDANLVNKVISGRGLVTSFTYDSSGNQLSISDVPVSSPVAGPFVWSKVSDSGPGARVRTALSYDSARGVVVLFGGRTTTPDVLNSETWEWDGTTWTERATTGPPATDRHALAYDSIRQQTVLFTGVIGNNSSLPGTWLWDGTTWRKANTPAHPSSAWGHSMAFDRDRGVVVLFGGAAGGNQTWEWNGTSWSFRTSAGPRPIDVDAHAMTYDSVRQRILLVCMTSVGTQTWEWNGTIWLLRNSNGPALAINAADGSLAFDETRGVAVLFGNAANGSQTWEWNGTTWTKRLLADPLPQGSHTITFDRAISAIVLFGGATLRETWEGRGEGDSDGLTDNTGTRIATYEHTFNRATKTTGERNHQTLYDIDPTNGNIRSVTRVVGSAGGADDVVTRYTYTDHDQV